MNTTRLATKNPRPAIDGACMPGRPARADRTEGEGCSQLAVIYAAVLLGTMAAGALLAMWG